MVRLSLTIQRESGSEPLSLKRASLKSGRVASLAGIEESQWDESLKVEEKLEDMQKSFASSAAPGGMKLVALSSCVCHSIDIG